MATHSLQWLLYSYNALDFQLEINFFFIIVEKIKNFCFLTNQEERLKKKFYLVMSGHSTFNFQMFLAGFLGILPRLRNQNKELEK